MPKKIYKIRRTFDGLFSRGGVFPTFNKDGKAWSSLRSLKLHLSNFKQQSYPERVWRWKRNVEIYKDCEVVEFEVVSGAYRKTVKEFLREEYPDVL